jgi:hypothetical protein
MTTSRPRFATALRNALSARTARSRRAARAAARLEISSRMVWSIASLTRVVARAASRGDFGTHASLPSRAETCGRAGRGVRRQRSDQPRLPPDRFLHCGGDRRNSAQLCEPLLPGFRFAVISLDAAFHLGRGSTKATIQARRNGPKAARARTRTSLRATCHAKTVGVTGDATNRFSRFPRPKG